MTDAAEQPSTNSSDGTPTVPNGRLDRWQRKLLDLSLRNRLLNFKSTLQSIPLLCPDPASLEDLLADDRRLSLITLPDPIPTADGSDDGNELREPLTATDIGAEFATDALLRRELPCRLPANELEKRLVTLYRSAKRDMAEGGSNTLFLAIGFLRWRKNASDKKTFRAPLLLMPVKLVRRGRQTPFRLQRHEDDTRFNSTLIQLLKKDFGLDLKFLESDLPQDEHGVDVSMILDQVRRLVQGIPSFEVVDECAIGRFSFAKYLLWKDLVDRTGQLKNNRVVRHLLEGRKKPFASAGGAIPQPADIDKSFHPQEIFHALDADSSQSAAVMAASAGKDFVLIGPPGTGKSQTIANIIAQCLATGKTVLFVAEKTAALDVVWRRLVQCGLGDCCVELHSNKAQRKNFLAQLKANWTHRHPVEKNDWSHVSKQLADRRDQLNEYVTAINQLHPNGWTAFDAYWESANDAQTSPASDITFDWKDPANHDRQTYEKMESAVEQLGDSFEALGDQAALPMLNATQWSIKWENELLEAADQLTGAAQALQRSTCDFTTEIGMSSVDDVSVQQMEALKQMAAAIGECEGHDVRILYQNQFTELPAAVDKLEAAVASYRTAYDSLDADYSESIERVPLEDFELQWRMANASFWPFSWLERRRVKRRLGIYAALEHGGEVNPANDLKAIGIIRTSRATIEGSRLKSLSVHWRGIDTDMELLRRQLQLATMMRAAIHGIGSAFQDTGDVFKKLEPFLSGANISNPLPRLAANFLQHSAVFDDSVQVFARLADKDPLEDSTPRVCESCLTAATALSDNRVGIKRWTSWCEAKATARALGLSGLVQKLQTKAVSQDQLPQCFRVAYARWFIAVLVDSTPALRTFEKLQHDKAIAEFVRLDALSRQLAAGEARQGMAHGLPEPSTVTKASELGLLRHQMELKRPSKSIRDVVTNMPDSFRKLAPCLLMSPLSIAQYLPANQAPFDVVIFDEASQMTTWDAIGAIARGKQTIVVGDPKQLPPTNFFGRSDEEDDTLDDEKDLESILDESIASGLPELLLNWHYRSRHESLIAFSNYQYYQNRLITFPAADDRDNAIQLRKVEGAAYDMGNSRTNRNEAQAIVDEAIRLMRVDLPLSPKQRRTFGVITFNMQQQSLIEDLFDEALKSNTDLEWYFDDNRSEPTVVKNLESVQGDERDVMFFSITFGPTKTNQRVGLNFGALNRDGGERRLNVAVTRARQQMLVYSSFDPKQLDASRSKSKGLKDLKKFLEFAHSGGTIALGELPPAGDGINSRFAEVVLESLVARGWTVVPQIGVSGFRIELGVLHPDKPGKYLAGIECDGPAYHQSASARDRDCTRRLVLEGLGWHMLRIWSPDWWHDPIGAADSIDAQLKTLREQH